MTDDSSERERRSAHSDADIDEQFTAIEPQKTTAMDRREYSLLKREEEIYLTLARTNPAAALVALEECLRDAEESELPVLQMRFLFTCAEICDHLGDHSSMDRYAARARTLGSGIRHSGARAYFCTMHGTYAMVKGSHEEARAHLQEAIVRKEELGETDWVLNQALGALNNALFNLGDYREALLAALRGLQVCSSIGHVRGIAPICQQLAAIYSRARFFQAAEDFLARGLQSSRTSGLVLEQADMLIDCAAMHGRMGRHDEALHCLFEARSMFAAIGNERKLSETLLSIGDQLLGTGRRAQAERFLGEALTMAEDLRLDLIRCRGLLASGRLQGELGEYTRASTTLQQALKLACEKNWRSESLAAHRELAVLAEALEEPEAAYRHYTQVNTLQTQLLSQEQQQSLAAISVQDSIREQQRQQELWREIKRKARQSIENIVASFQDATQLLDQHNETLMLVRTTVQIPVASTARPLRQLRTRIQELCDTQGETARDTRVQSEARQLREQDFVAWLRREAADLTATELRVCLLIRQGHSINQIADALYVSRETVRSHRKHIRKKLTIAPGADLHGVFIRV